MADGTVKITIEADGNKAIKSAKDLENVFGQLGKGGKTDGLTSDLDGVAKHSGTAKVGVMELATSIGLVKVASTAFGFVTSGLGEVIKGLNESSATWQTFEGNMKGFGKSGAEIAKVKKELQAYAQQTIYSASDMASTYAQLAAVGTKNTTQLVKGFGGLAAAAEDPQQAMKSLSQQATQMAAKPKVAWEDFKIMLEQTPAGMAAVAKEMGMSLTDLVSKIQDGSIKTDDFFDAIAKAGNNDSFGKMATQYKTVGEAMDGLVETLTNKLQPAFDQLSKMAIGWVSSFTDSLDNIDLGGMINSVMSAFNGLSKKLFPIFGNLKTLFTEALSSINFSVVSKALQDGMKPITALFNGLLAIVNDVIVHILEIFKSMKPAIEQVFNSNAGATFGKAMSSAADMIRAAFKAVITVASNLTKIITSIDWVPVFTAAKGAIDLMYSAIKKIADLLKVAFKSDAFQALIVGIIAGVAAFELIKGAVTAFQTAMTAFNAVMQIGAAVQTAFNAIMAVNPFILIGVALAALVAGLVYFFTQTESGKEIWANFTAFLTQTWQATVAVAQTIWTALAAFFSGLWTGITTFATAIWTSLVASLGGIWNGLVTYASGVFNLLKAVIMGPILLLVDLVTGNFDQMKSDAILIWNSIKAAAGQIWNGLSAMVSGIVSNFVSSVSGLFRAMAGLVVGIWNGLKAMVVGIAQGIASGAINAWNGMVSGVRGIISSVRSIFNSLRDINLFSIGKHIVQGLIDGIGGMIGNVRDKISELASTVTNGIRKALKIHSPSRVMAELGMYTGMGFSNGIEGMIPTAKKMSKKLAEAAMINKTFGVNSEFAGITAESASGIGRGVAPTNSVVNNYGNTATTTVQTAKESNDKVLEALNKIANNRPVAVVDGSSFAPAYEQYGSTETARRSQMKGRGLAVDSKF
ncbi:tape measure protein [Latilactobacillus curvatus]|uniref:phage tail protein n=1 Tax=Latilactobacillus curvatus TaxID=28038 RepID=UPI0011BAEE2F|nr:tape measure protein [Latilactobacillus curvatus]QEA50077.1 tape measure protein [Latilactobacillus curvatus]